MSLFAVIGKFQVNSFSVQLSVSNGSIIYIIKALRFSSFSRWVSQSLTKDHTFQMKVVVLFWSFMSKIVAHEKTWVHHFEPELKGSQWIIQDHEEKKLKTPPSAGKAMVTVIWDIGDAILLDVMPRGEPIRL